MMDIGKIVTTTLKHGCGPLSLIVVVVIKAYNTN